MSKAWDALSQYDRDYIIDYVCGAHRDELGIALLVARDHEDRDVRDAAAAAEAALERCSAVLVLRHEGDVAREIEKRRGEAAVSMLAATLALVGVPRAAYSGPLLTLPAGANRAPEPEWPRFPYAGPPGAVFIGRNGNHDVWYRTEDGLLPLVWDGGYSLYTADDVRSLSSFRAIVAIIDAHLATRAVEPEYRTEYKCEWLPAEGPRWQYKSATDKYIGQADHEDLYWQPDIDRVGCVWSDGLTHGGYMRDTLNGSTSPRLVRVRAMLDAHLARSAK